MHRNLLVGPNHMRAHGGVQRRRGDGVRSMWRMFMSSVGCNGDNVGRGEGDVCQKWRARVDLMESCGCMRPIWRVGRKVPGLRLGSIPFVSNRECMRRSSCCTPCDFNWLNFDPNSDVNPEGNRIQILILNWIFVSFISRRVRVGV